MLQEAGGPHIASAGAREQGGKKGWERGLGSRSQSRPLLPLAPCSAASSGLPGLPAPPRPAPELGPERPGGLIQERGREHEARRREGGSGGGGRRGREGTLLAVLPSQRGAASGRAKGCAAAAGPGQDAGLPGPRGAGRAAAAGRRRELSVVLKRRQWQRPGARSRGALLGVPPQPRGESAVAHRPMPGPRAPRRRRDRPRQDR